MRVVRVSRVSGCQDFRTFIIVRVIIIVRLLKDLKEGL
jgi:hypothetical protein